MKIARSVGYILHSQRGSPISILHSNFDSLFTNTVVFLRFQVKEVYSHALSDLFGNSLCHPKESRRRKPVRISVGDRFIVRLLSPLTKFIGPSEWRSFSGKWRACDFLGACETRVTRTSRKGTGDRMAAVHDWRITIDTRQAPVLNRSSTFLPVFWLADAVSPPFFVPCVPSSRLSSSTKFNISTTNDLFPKRSRE